jgi:hypothetical protein
MISFVCDGQARVLNEFPMCGEDPSHRSVSIGIEASRAGSIARELSQIWEFERRHGSIFAIISFWLYILVMSKCVDRTPPPHLFRGDLGAELIVLSSSAVRVAQRLDSKLEIETADGVVMGWPGDFVIGLPSGERYPISPSIFYGTYQVLSRAGSRFVGRRLFHDRRAWPIESPFAEFDYGPQRGKVSGERGGWVYQSDEDDYGLINVKAKDEGHIVVGTAAALANTNWERRFKIAVWLLSLLSPALTLVALVAFASALKDDHLLSRTLLIVEAIGLVLGVGFFWWIRRDKWVLKSALNSETTIAREFQSAVEILGRRPSQLFPSMALWRAAQDEQKAAPNLSSSSLRNLKEQVGKTYGRLQKEIEDHHAKEAISTTLSWISALTILFCIGYAVYAHALLSELLAIWLPSAVGAVHGSVWRRQLVHRIGAGKEFLSELSFVQRQLNTLVPEDKLDQSNEKHVEILTATLRALCQSAAEHTQRRLQFAIAEDPSIPI